MANTCQAPLGAPHPGSCAPLVTPKHSTCLAPAGSRSGSSTWGRRQLCCAHLWGGGPRMGPAPMGALKFPHTHTVLTVTPKAPRSPALGQARGRALQTQLSQTGWTLPG